MKVTQGCVLHNKFEIEVRDSRTGELKQSAEAYNIVLDACFTRLVNWQTFCSHIHTGTGTGTLSPTRTSLFTFLDARAASDVTIVKALPTSSWKRKIVINPEEYVGSVFTEVGCAYGTTSTYLTTHAMIKDSEGNPITITKTDVDVITIYSTIYFTFSTQDAGINMVGMNDNNSLVNYLTSGSMATLYLFSGRCGDVGGADKNSGPTIGSLLMQHGTSVTTANWVKDAANKKVTLPARRFQAADSNGEILELALGTNGGGYPGLARFVVPMAGLWADFDFAGKIIGTGNGVTKKFNVTGSPAHRWLDDSPFTVKLDGVTTTAYTKKKYRLLNYVHTLSTTTWGAYNQYGVAFSPDGQYAVLTGVKQTYMYKFNGYRWDYVRDFGPAADDVIWLGQHLIYADGTNGFVVYKGTPETGYTLLYEYVYESASRLAANPAGDLILSNDSSSLGTPTAILFTRSGDTFTKVATNPPSQPSGRKYAVAFSPDGTMAVIGSDASPFLAMYTVSGTTFTAKTIDVAPSGTVRCAAFTPDNAFLVVGLEASPWVEYYSISAGNLTKVGTLPNTGATGMVSEMRFSPDGILFLLKANSPYCEMHEYTTADGFFSLGDQTTWFSGAPYETTKLAFSPDGNKAIMGAAGGRGFIFDSAPSRHLIKFDSAPGAGVSITLDGVTQCIPKNSDNMLDFVFTIQYGSL